MSPPAAPSPTTHPLITYTCTHTSPPSHPLPLPLSLTTSPLPAHTTISLPHPCSTCHLTLLRTRLHNISHVHDPAIEDLQRKIERVRKEPAIWNGGNPELMRGYMRAHETLRGLLEARKREQEGVTAEWVGVWGEWERGKGGVMG